MKNIFLILHFLFISITFSWADIPSSVILDDFNRANEGPPPSANYTDIYGSSDLRVVSNQLTPGVSTTLTSGYGWKWGTVAYGPDCEVFITIVDIGSSASAAGRLYLRVPISGLTGYSLQWNSFENTIKINKIVAGSEVVLGATISQTITSGDSIALQAIGSDINVYYKVGAGSWTLVGTRSDSSYSSAGYLGFDLYNPGVGTNPILDNFGGGTIIIPEVSYVRSSLKNIIINKNMVFK